MRVAVCDDEQLFRQAIKDVVYGYSNMRNLALAVDEFLCGEALLNDKHKHDIVLMDYKMGDINGLDAARALRKKDVNCAIIFITNYPHFVYEAFEVCTFRFFEKPIDAAKLCRAFDKYYELFGDNYPLLLKENRDTVCVNINEIVFLEADDKKCYVHLADKETLHCTKTMKEIASLVPEHIFYKVNKSFIVNFNYIRKYNEDGIYFKTGETAPVSRKYSAQFKNAYLEYAKSRMI